MLCFRLIIQSFALEDRRNREGPPIRIRDWTGLQQQSLGFGLFEEAPTAGHSTGAM